MSIDLYINIVERPDNFDYPSKFRQIYGFTENDCEKAIKSFTDLGFTVAYTANIKLKDGYSVEDIARQINNILEFSNRKNSLDKKSLDELLK